MNLQRENFIQHERGSTVVDHRTLPLALSCISTLIQHVDAMFNECLKAEKTNASDDDIKGVWKISQHVIIIC